MTAYGNESFLSPHRLHSFCTVQHTPPLKATLAHTLSLSLSLSVLVFHHHAVSKCHPQMELMHTQYTDIALRCERSIPILGGDPVI